MRRLNALIDAVTQTRDPKLLVSFVPQFRACTVRKNETLIAQGDVWNRAFFVEHGLLHTHLVDRAGKSCSNSFYSEGSLIFPLTQQLELHASLFSISSLERSTVWSVDINLFRTALQTHGLWEDLRVELLARLLHRKLQREYELVMLDGTQRYLRFCGNMPDLADRVPLAHIASYLGLTDVSLSRIRRRLREKPA